MMTVSRTMGGYHGAMTQVKPLRPWQGISRRFTPLLREKATPLDSYDAMTLTFLAQAHAAQGETVEQVHTTEIALQILLQLSETFLTNTTKHQTLEQAQLLRSYHHYAAFLQRSGGAAREVEVLERTLLAQSVQYQQAIDTLEVLQRQEVTKSQGGSDRTQLVRQLEERRELQRQCVIQEREKLETVRTQLTRELSHQRTVLARETTQLHTLERQLRTTPGGDTVLLARTQTQGVQSHIQQYFSTNQTKNIVKSTGKSSPMARFVSPMITVENLQSVTQYTSLQTHKERLLQTVEAMDAPLVENLWATLSTSEQLQLKVENVQQKTIQTETNLTQQATPPTVQQRLVTLVEGSDAPTYLQILQVLRQSYISPTRPASQLQVGTHTATQALVETVTQIHSDSERQIQIQHETNSMFHQQTSEQTVVHALEKALTPVVQEMEPLIPVSQLSVTQAPSPGEIFATGTQANLHL